MSLDSLALAGSQGCPNIKKRRQAAETNLARCSVGNQDEMTQAAWTKARCFFPFNEGPFQIREKPPNSQKHRFSVMILNWRQIHWMQAQLWSWMRAMATETVAAVNRGMQLEKMSDAAHRNDEFLNRAFR